MVTTSNTEPKRIAIIGATGSIGTQTLDIAARHPELYRPVVLTAGSKVDALAALCRVHKPRMAVIADESRYADLCRELKPLGIECAAGAEAMAEAAALPDVDMTVTATVGYSGLLPTIRAVEAGKEIALANKETLVVAGALIERLLEKSESKIYPVDSEHSAIYQCLQGEDRDKVSRLVITASGGPFRTWTKEQISRAKASDALKHPNWDMGAKITIDSATMMNKAFELIEARWLFGIGADRLSAVVHPQSIVHSMVEFSDGGMKAQLGVPDMHLPIAYALGCAERLPGAERPLSLADMATLTFEQPDEERFPCLTLADLALRRGGNTACVINAANEVAVAAYLHDRIGFYDIYRIICDTLERCAFIAAPGLSDYIQTNQTAREIAGTMI
ncbi:MAG: 1-deoxy-D-xylulose-5-phosphate reductoisomerase [Muribaculaceae bacterium]|nr:1-deoxy-D-xylulose-5-phosphate reductoisomerase [Muribaculaceae bacterium]MDE6131465.1 1-deoxy-D-xylulose-5-phosphate reductoisomerase [Muribaculaceae bacterium]